MKSIRQLLEQNLKEKASYIPSKIDTMICQEMDGVSVVNSNLASDTFNMVFAKCIDETTCRRVYDYYRKLKLPFAWWVLSEMEQAQTILSKQGLIHEEEEVGMVCDLTNISQTYEPSKQLTIQQCKTRADYADFATVLSSIFDPPDEQIKVFYKKMASLREEQVEKMPLFVGYEDQSPVVTACLFLTEVAGIYDVATKAEKRRKGYGSFMFRYMLQEARKRGYTTAVLQASVEGINIYKRFGFKEICRFHIWNKSF